MKIKSMTILTVVILFLIIAQYFFLPVWYRELGVTVSGWLIMLSATIAIGFSGWLIHLGIQNLILSAAQISRFGSYIGGYGVYPFALFLGFIIGGNIGGAIGENLLGDLGIVIGIGFGIFLVTLFFSSIGAFVGYLLGSLIQKF